jgi:hypothetical protein
MNLLQQILWGIKSDPNNGSLQNMMADPNNGGIQRMIAGPNGGGNPNIDLRTGQPINTPQPINIGGGGGDNPNIDMTTGKPKYPNIDYLGGSPTFNEGWGSPMMNAMRPRFQPYNGGFVPPNRGGRVPNISRPTQQNNLLSSIYNNMNMAIV